MVLEPMEKSLWDARVQRQLAMREIKRAMKGALLGLRDIHQEGLVFAGSFDRFCGYGLLPDLLTQAILDFKMENVLLNGFNNPSNNPYLICTKLADLGSGMIALAPLKGSV